MAELMDGDVEALLARLRDPNIRFPARPRLVADLHVFAMPDGLGLQLRGGAEPVLLRGRFAETALAFLLPRLDGAHSLAALLDACPSDVPRATLLRALTLLHGKGLLVEAAPEPDHDAGDILWRQLLYWERHLGLTRGADSAREVQRRLATTRVTLVGTGYFGLAVYSLLAGAGCTQLRVLAWNDDGLLARALAESPVVPSELTQLPTTAVETAAGQLRAWRDDTDFLVTATCDAPAVLFRAINRLCLAHDLPWLHGNTSGGRADIGPFVQPHQSGCYCCLELRQASMQEHAIEEYLYQEHLAAARPAAERILLGEASWAATLCASLLAAEVIRVSTGIAPPTLLNAVVQVAPVAGELQRNTFLRVPRCPECYRGPVPAHPVDAEPGLNGV
ncbi:MAG: TOMM precursor leader peptide-binding protein [Thermomicrobiales bacterium]